MQALYEPADSISYGHLLVRQPPEGTSPKNVFQPIGFDDNYTPRPTLEALATAIGCDLLAPELQPIAGLALFGKTVLAPPVANNVGEVTAMSAQYRPREGQDAHFVSFDIPLARRQSTLFFKTLVDTGTASVVAAIAACWVAACWVAACCLERRKND